MCTAQMHAHTHSLIKRWVKDLNKQVSKENTQTANRYMEKCLASLITQEMQIKTTVRSQLERTGEVLRRVWGRRKPHEPLVGV